MSKCPLIVVDYTVHMTDPIDFEERKNYYLILVRQTLLVDSKHLLDHPFFTLEAAIAASGEKHSFAPLWPK